MWISRSSGPTTTPETLSAPLVGCGLDESPTALEWTPSVARAAIEAALASWIPSDKISLALG